MDSTLLRALLVDYEARRNAHEQNARQRRLDLLACHEQYAALEKRIERIHLDGFKRVLETQEQSIQDIDAQIDALRREQADILTCLGHPEDYLNPAYDCPDCGDTGYQPNAGMCHCLRQRLLRERYTRSRIDPKQCFDAFDSMIFPDHAIEGMKYSQRELMQRLREVCHSYAASFPQSAKANLLLHGGTGLGKTFLLHCIANEVISRGFTVMMVTAYQLYQELMRDLRGATRALPDEKVDLFILDDLGVEPMVQNITIETLFNLLNERLLRGQHTIISTNLTLPQIKQRYFDRVLSRMVDPATTGVYRLYGEDVRLRRG